MKIENHTISNIYIRKHFENGLRIGVDRQRLLTSSGLSEELIYQPLARVRPQVMADLINCVARERDDEFLGMTDRTVRCGSFAYLAEHLGAHKTLLDVYEEMIRFYNLVAGGVRFSLSTNGEQALFAMRHDPALNPKINLLIDFLMLIWHRFPGWLIGQTIPLHHVQLPFAKPEHVSEYRFVFPSACRFEEEQSALVFDQQWLQAPVIQSKAQLLAYLPTLPVQWFQKQGYQKLITTQILQKLEQVEWGADTSIEQIASQLHMTARTLRRKLTAEGYSFQHLKNELRRDQAINLLGDSTHTISQIALQVGFSEPAAFTRAFKKWTGISPRRYRQSWRVD